MKKNYLFIVLIVLSIILAACSSNDDNNITPEDSNNTPDLSSNSTSDSENSGPTDYTLPISDGSSVISVMGMDQSPPFSLKDQLPIWEAIEEDTGVKIDWQVTPGSEGYKPMQLRLSTGTDLPDIIPALGVDPIDSMEKGLVIPLNDLISEYAPNIRAFFENNPSIKSAITAPDGEIYGLPQILTDAPYYDPDGILIRQDWMDKLDLDTPRTLDEWATVLRAIKEQDPNENGEQDEIPLAPKGANLRGLVGHFGSAVGAHLRYSNGFYPDENGKITYEYLGEGVHELIKWMRDMYAEGLIDPRFMSLKNAERVASISQNKVGVTYGYLNNTTNFNSLLHEDGVTNANWQMIEPPANEGFEGFYDMQGPVCCYHGISKDSEQPELVMKWLDYVYASKEGALYQNYGIEGKSYKMVNGEPEYTDWAANHPSGLRTAIVEQGGLTLALPFIRAYDTELPSQGSGFKKAYPELKKQADKITPYNSPSIHYLVALPTSEQAERYANLYVDLRAYQEETLANFVLGREAIDWDKFVSTMKSLGIDELVADYQERYDRAQAQQ